MQGFVAYSARGKRLVRGLLEERGAIEAVLGLFSGRLAQQAVNVQVRSPANRHRLQSPARHRGHRNNRDNGQSWEPERCKAPPDIEGIET
jgi:hypothetical protein